MAGTCILIFNDDDKSINTYLIFYQVRVSDKPGQVNAKLGGQLKLWAGSVFMTGQQPL